MSVQTELDRIIGLVHDSHEKAKAKGGTTAEPYLLANLPGAIESIPQLDTSDATATAFDMVDGTTAYVNGKKVIGEIPKRTNNDLTVSGASVSVPAGYYKNSVSASIATATQATPSISVDTRGKITASATQSAGYVPSGTKSATKQLTTQAAKTYTPGTADQTIDPGTYLIGYQTIKGDSNLVPENIRKDVSIFGVTGTMEAGSKTVSVTVENTSVYGFDADGNPITATNGTYDFLGGIIYLRSINTSINGNFINHPVVPNFLVCLSDGGTLSQSTSSGGSAS